jgi:hypothetical protein
MDVKTSFQKRFARRFYRNRSILKKTTKEICLEFDVKVSEVNFDLAWFRLVELGLMLVDW